ncbi:DNA polymerase delta subunit 4-like [Anneissia japonica]|uniref:DNA polymerase delta subunit 4-like n=1 Tax=Anneissia japonica TaxID=1529436 RepID=UPI001425893A|nr:DNA polymerase delta subunit 4-like [Anneissia japonica]
MSSSKLSTYFRVKKESSESSKKKRNKQEKILPKRTATEPELTAADILHQKQLQVLRAFDLKWEYGPCVGVSRLERWEHAEQHNLNPPPAIKKLIEDHIDDETYTQCVWNGFEI